MLHWWLESPPASNRVGDRNEGWKTDGAPASTRLPPPAGMPDDDRCCHGNSDSSLQVRALTPGCLCFGSVGSVWSVRIYVKAARVGRSRLSKSAAALASLRYLVRLLWPPRAALSRGRVSERGLVPLRPATGESGELFVTSNRKDYRRYLCLTIPDCGIAMTTRTWDSSTRTLKQNVSPEDT